MQALIPWLESGPPDTQCLDCLDFENLWGLVQLAAPDDLQDGMARLSMQDLRKLHRITTGAAGLLNLFTRMYDSMEDMQSLPLPLKTPLQELVVLMSKECNDTRMIDGMNDGMPVSRCAREVPSF